MANVYNTLKPSRKVLLQILVDHNLFSWMSEEEAAQRQQRRIEKEREESILWTAWYNALVWLGNNRGDCNLNSHGTITLPDGSEAELGKWLHIQKKYIKKGTLSLERCGKILDLIRENKLDRNYWMKYFLMTYPMGTFSEEYPDLFLVLNNNSNNNSSINMTESSVSSVSIHETTKTPAAYIHESEVLYKPSA
jgi:hypothetical protein